MSTRLLAALLLLSPIARAETDYRALQRTFRQAKQGDWVLMPLYPYGPNESLLDLPGTPPHAPSAAHWFGTDDRARDVLVRLAYGFNTSLTFALFVMLVADGFGIAVGAALGRLGLARPAGAEVRAVASAAPSCAPYIQPMPTPASTMATQVRGAMR